MQSSIPCFTVVLLAIASAGYAQENSIKVGFKLQPEITLKLSNDENYRDKNGITHEFNKFSFNFGAQFVYSFSERFAFETGIYYQRQLFSYHVDLYDVTVKESFVYIQLPLLLRYEAKHLFFTFGPSINNQNRSLREYSTGDREEDWHKDDGETFVGIVGSVGRDWPVTDKLSIITELRLSGVPGHPVGGNLGIGFGANYRF